ncbi:hypothetical protein DFH09DRAFT_1188474 [Mycena vulgaris]|nr:hypothetical protein DFH09DRAFT_1188474 [Mycena vulgaris]
MELARIPVKDLIEATKTQIYNLSTEITHLTLLRENEMKKLAELQLQAADLALSQISPQDNADEKLTPAQVSQFRTITTTIAAESTPDLFPVFLHVHNPPAPKGTLKNGRRTPLYALGWVRDLGDVVRENPGVDTSCLALEVFTRRFPDPEQKIFPGFALYPETFYGPTKYCILYHVLEFNTSQARIDQFTQNDELVEACRFSMRIPPEDDYTLRWYRLPTTHQNPREVLRDVRDV